MCNCHNNCACDRAKCFARMAAEAACRAERAAQMASAEACRIKEMLERANCIAAEAAACAEKAMEAARCAEKAAEDVCKPRCDCGCDRPMPQMNGDCGCGQQHDHDDCGCDRPMQQNNCGCADGGRMNGCYRTLNYRDCVK